MPPAEQEPTAVVEQKPRFSWPMRFFLSFLLFDMVYHSFSSLTPYREWLTEWKAERFPKGLPTWDEIAEMTEPKAGQGKKEGRAPLTERIYETLDSGWEYFKPWPSRELRPKIVTWADRGKFVLAWTTSRLDFMENLIGVPQRWSMFSPNASKEVTVARLRLLFEDGSRQDVRLTADPPDLTVYSHWFEEKVLDCELKVAGDWDSRLGYCNYLAHQHAKNHAGAPLTAIFVYTIHYRYPDPDEDALKVLRSQNGPPNWDRDGPSWEYQVASGRMRKLSDSERIAKKRRLDSAKAL